MPTIHFTGVNFPSTTDYAKLQVVLLEQSIDFFYKLDMTIHTDVLPAEVAQEQRGKLAQYFVYTNGQPTPNFNFNQSIKTRDARRRWGTQTDASTVMAAHRRLSPATRSNDDFGWPVHSLMLSFHDLCALALRRLPSMMPCSMIFGCILRR